MVELLGTFMAIVGIAVFCALGAAHERWATAARLPVRRKHRCWKCGYDLTAVEVDLCPECGADRARVEPLTERRRAVIAGWIAPAAVACLFGLAATRPDLIGAVLLGAVLTAFVATVCRTIPIRVFFAALAAGLTFAALAGFAGREESRGGEEVLTWAAGAMLFGVPMAAALVYLVWGRIHPDTAAALPTPRRRS